jgi:hypothetical protein
MGAIPLVPNQTNAHAAEEGSMGFSAVALLLCEIIGTKAIIMMGDGAELCLCNL